MEKVANIDEFSKVRFGDLKEGDIVIDGQGNEATVTKAYDIHLPKKMYEMVFEDGSVVKASGNHLWYIETVEDIKNHSKRLKEAKTLFKKFDKKQNTDVADWREEAFAVATSEEKYEIGAKDLITFFDFITDDWSRYEIVDRVLKSVGHIVEETTEYKDFVFDEKVEKFEEVYDARRVFQQFLSLTGGKKYRSLWPVIVGRVVTTEEIFEKYQDADIPTVQLRS